MTRHEAIGAACAAALSDAHGKMDGDRNGRADVYELTRGGFEVSAPNSGFPSYQLRVVVTATIDATIDPRTLFGVVMVNAVDGLEPF